MKLACQIWASKITGMTILPYEPRHAEAWRTLNEAWISTLFVLEAKDREVLNDPQGKVIDKGGEIFIAEQNGEAFGCVALLPMGDGGYELAKMTVSEAARGTGLGRRLMETCIARALELEARRLYLETNSGLGPALGLYRAVGFVDLPARETAYARADVFMELALS